MRISINRGIDTAQTDITIRYLDWPTTSGDALRTQAISSAQSMIWLYIRYGGSNSDEYIWTMRQRVDVRALRLLWTSVITPSFGSHVSHQLSMSLASQAWWISNVPERLLNIIWRPSSTQRGIWNLILIIMCYKTLTIRFLYGVADYCINQFRSWPRFEGPKTITLLNTSYALEEPVVNHIE